MPDGSSYLDSAIVAGLSAGPWTAELVRERLLEMGSILRRLPAGKFLYPPGIRPSLPDQVRTEREEFAAAVSRYELVSRETRARPAIELEGPSGKLEPIGQEQRRTASEVYGLARPGSLDVLPDELARYDQAAQWIGRYVAHPTFEPKTWKMRRVLWCWSVWRQRDGQPMSPGRMCKGLKKIGIHCDGRTVSSWLRAGVQQITDGLNGKTHC